MLKNILYLSIFTTVVVAAAVFLSIYHNFTSNSVSADTTIQVEQIPDSFDATTVDAIKDRKVVPVDLSVTLLSSGAQTSPATSSAKQSAPTPTPREVSPLTSPTEVTTQATSSSQTNTGLPL
jgi:hypothetical protein